MCHELTYSKTILTSRRQTWTTLSSTRRLTRGVDGPVHVKLLLDENLSPRVTLALQADGVDACSVRDRGMNGATDPEVLDLAFREDRTS